METYEKHRNQTGIGKGDKRRPMEISDKEFTENWERIFGKKDKPVETEPKQ
jgi:hypothetical protein